MFITTNQNATIRPVNLSVNTLLANGDRNVLGRMRVEPPVESSLSQGRTFLPPLPFPDQKPGRKDDGDPALRYPASSAPAGSVGSAPGSPVCRTVRMLGTTPAVRTEAAAVLLESKLDPFGRRRDCQSLPARTDTHAELKANPSWPQATTTAATAAAQ
ncbi:MAG: hypothetical protein MUF18_17615 [Fimbriiglobus sp.]|jgi:hypothetical protein|nr:hypothetical protein [Fimbriiglobus sp.]